MKFLVRADGGPSVGMGHLKKQMILMKRLRLRFKYDFVFFIKDESEGHAWLKKQGVRVFKIPAIKKEREPAWMIRRVGAQKAVLLLDILDTAESYVREFKKAGVPVITFENRGSSQKLADATINAIVEGPKNKVIRYGKARVFKGASYRIFHPDYTGVKKIKRAAPEKNIRFCVTMGGGDMKLSRLIARELRSFFPESSVTVVEGPGSRGSFREKGVKVLKAQQSLAKVFAESDFAVTAGGGTLYETALTGLPAAAFALKKHQVRNIKFFEKRKSVIYGGMLDRKNVSAVMSVIKKVLNDKKSYHSLSRAGQKIADGKGLERIVGIIKKITEKMK